jgi:hypothetical protein
VISLPASFSFFPFSHTCTHKAHATIPKYGTVWCYLQGGLAEGVHTRAYTCKHAYIHTRTQTGPCTIEAGSVQDGAVVTVRCTWTMKPRELSPQVSEEDMCFILLLHMVKRHCVLCWWKHIWKVAFLTERGSNHCQSSFTHPKLSHLSAHAKITYTITRGEQLRPKIHMFWYVLSLICGKNHPASVLTCYKSVSLGPCLWM